MNWRSFLEALSPQIVLSSPVTDAALSRGEAALGVRLPPELRLLLQQSNGVSGEYELAQVWPMERIVEDNLTFRNNARLGELYMPFDSLLFRAASRFAMS